MTENIKESFHRKLSFFGKEWYNRYHGDKIEKTIQRLTQEKSLDMMGVEVYDVYYWERF